MRRLLVFAPCVAAFLGQGDAASASTTGIAVETIGNYTFQGSTNTDANTEGEGFWNAMTASGTGYTTKHHFEDNNVYDTDFYDPDLTGNVSDNDMYNFDWAGTNIAFAIGHGLCNDFGATCNTDSDCGAGGYCPGGGALNAGQQRTCIKETQRTFLTSSTASIHGNALQYGVNYGGSTAKNAAFGEDSASGNWDGAGTNGGDNVVFLTNSCGFRRAYMLQDTTWMFAGMHAFFFNMPTKAFRTSDGKQAFSDTAQWSSRGSNVATTILANPSAAMYMAWLNSTQVNNSYNLNNGGSTDSMTGIVGEGANVVIGEDVSSAAAQARTNSETWSDSQDEGIDPVGASYWSYHYLCNFDCNTYGW